MTPQKMAMELQVLRAENHRFAQTIKHLSNELERANASLQGAHVFEQLLNSAISGFSTQPRAARHPFYQKDDATGEVVPLDGGPQWVVEQAFETMGRALESLKGTFQASEPDHEAPQEAEPGLQLVETHSEAMESAPEEAKPSQIITSSD